MKSSGSMKCERGMVAVLALAAAFGGGSLPARAGAPAGPQVCLLSYTTGVFSLDVPIDLQEREVVFRKEPAFGGQGVIRGAIPIGRGKADFIGFAVDMTERALYVDKNRNLDLTDDPPDKLQGEEVAGYAHFENESIELPMDGTVVRYAFELACYGTGGRPFCQLTVHSGWMGEVTLAGERWRLGVVDNLDGHIGEGDRFTLSARAAEQGDDTGNESDFLPAATGLCVNGDTVALAFAVKGSAPTPELELTLSPLPLATGTLELQGTFVERLLLQGGPATVVLHRPSGAVAVPADRYDEAVLYVSEPGARQRFQATTRLDPVRVIAGRTVSLKAGAPLCNSVAVTRAGGALQLSYKLTGTDGREYRASTPRADVKPQFEIARDGATVATGAFEYG